MMKSPRKRSQICIFFFWHQPFNMACSLNEEITIKTFLQTLNSNNRPRAPSKNSAPSAALSATVIKQTFCSFSKDRVQWGRVCITCHLFFSSLRESQVWKADKVLIVPFLPSFLMEVRGIEVKPLAFEEVSLLILHSQGVSVLVSTD